MHLMKAYGNFLFSEFREDENLTGDKNLKQHGENNQALC